MMRVRSAGAVTVLSLMLAVVPTHGAVAKEIRGTAGPDVLTGTVRADMLYGRAGDDRLVGKGGEDRLKGGPGDDSLEGGPGLDVLEGGHGNDHAHGGRGKDSLFGHPGSDRLHGGKGSDTIVGGRDHDSLLGGPGGDTILGGPGRDVVHPAGGADDVRLGGGADRLFLHVDDDADAIDCGGGEDVVVQVVAADSADTFVDCERFELVFSATPDDTATVAGSVFALAAAGDRTIVGGSFTRLGSRARGNVGALLHDGTVDPQFVANTDGKVEALATSADGSTVFIGGRFTTVNGVERANLAAVDAQTGVVRTDWSADTAGANPTVQSLAVHGDRLYVAGKYVGIDGTEHAKLSAVDTASGNVIVAFDPKPNGTVREVVVTPDGSTVFAGGSFSRLGRATRENHVGAVDAVDGSATAFDPVPDKPSGVVTVALSPDGSRLFVATHTNRLYAFDWEASNLQAWKAKTNGNVQAIAASDTQVYVGGHWSRFERLERPYLGSVDYETGDPTSWDTTCTGGNMGVWALLIQDSSLHAGGVFSSFGGDPQRGYARFTGTP